MTGRPATDATAIYLELVKEIEKTTDPNRKVQLYGMMSLIESSRGLNSGLPHNETFARLYPDMQADLDTAKRATEEYVDELLQAVRSLNAGDFDAILSLTSKSKAVLAINADVNAKMKALMQKSGMDLEDLDLEGFQKEPESRTFN